MLIADCHADTLSRLLILPEEQMSLTLPQPLHHADLPRMQQAQLGVQVFSIFTMPYEAGHYGTVRCLQMMEIYRRDVAKYQDLILVETSSDLEGAEQQVKRLYGIFSMEGASPLCGDLKLLDVFYRQGLRAVGLTWNHRNDLADGVGVGSSFGLTPFGRDVVTRMNELGMVVDLAHINEAGYWEVLELSRDPVIVSHANAKALCQHRRNLTDTQLDALKEKDGFIGICFAPSFLNSDPSLASLEDVIRHIDYICERIGPRHVAFGSDYDGIAHTPLGLEEVSCFPKVMARLESMGYSAEDQASIAHGNVLRIYRQILHEKE